MTRPRYSVEWFLLVSYFAVASLNVPAGIGGDRSGTNRTNAQLILALILVSPVLFAFASTGLLGGGFIRRHTFLFGLALLVPGWLFVSRWLNSEREAKYRQTYSKMRPPARTAFGLITAMLTIAGWLIFMSPR